MLAFTGFSNQKINLPTYHVPAVSYALPLRTA